MRTVGIICEYNPFHNGHLRQLRLAREAAGEDCALICLMSGNWVQRGEPAIFPKTLRAEAALRSVADLVLELPLTVALSSAEGFAAGGVSILTALGCDFLCYGIESEDNDQIMSTAKANLDPAFDALLRTELAAGCSYPTARQRALEKLQSLPVKTVGVDAHIDPPSENQNPSVLSNPNDLLAVEYCKAILKQGSPIQPLPIHRTGSYYADALDPEAPSATALRAALKAFPLGGRCPSAHTGADEGMCRQENDWRTAVPYEVIDLYESTPIHTLEAGERSILAFLRTLPDEAFVSLPFGSEGLWSKFMKNCRSCASVEEIVNATKSKRYTRSRIQRMLLCAFLGLTKEDLERQPPYVRILGFTERGRAALREMKHRFPLVNAGERPADPEYYNLENRAADLYGLFSAGLPEPPQSEAGLRVRVLP